MTDEVIMPDFDQLADLYWELGVMQSPSQLQGYLVGWLSAGDEFEHQQWLKQASRFIDAVQQPDEAGNALLTDLLEASSSALASSEMTFQLLLPDDAVEISLRVDALGQWCQGFMAGFAQSGKRVQQQHGQQQYSSDVSEAISDLAAISQISLTEEDQAAQSEQQFFELAEYVRVASMTIYLDCRKGVAVPVNSAQTKTVKNRQKVELSPSALFGSNKKKLH